MAKRYAEWIVRQRWLVMALSLALIALTASGARLLSFTADYRVFFGAENPELLAFETLQNTYTKNDNALFVLTPKDGNVFTRDTLASIEWLTQQGWQTPYSIRVDSITNFQHTRAAGDDLVVADLVSNAGQLSDAELDEIRRIALAEPLLANKLIAPNGRVTGVNITVQLPGVDTGVENPIVVNFVRDLADQLRVRDPNLDVRLVGVVMMNNAFPEASFADMRTLVPAMFAVVIITLALMLRFVTGTALTVLVILVSITTAMGLAGWLGIRLTPPSSTAPTIILTLAVANCVHLLASFLYEMRYHSRDKATAIIESLRINFQPIFLTSITTAIGFLSMNFSDAPPFHDLGNIVAMGVIAAFIFSVTLLPALLVVLPIRVKPRAASAAPHSMDRFAEFVVRRRRALLWGMGAMIVGLVAFIPQNELNDEFVKYFDESIEFRRATDYATENLTGTYFIDYSLKAQEPGGISDPAFLAKTEQFVEWWRAQPETTHVATLTDILKRLNKNLHSDDPAWYRVPRERDLAAQYLLLYEMSLPYGLDLNDRINVDKSATRVTVTLPSLSTNQTLELEQRAQRWLAENAPEFTDAKGSGPAIMFSHIGARNIRSMLFGTAVALVLISMILIVALRSLKIGLVSMIPNLVPAGMAFGLWGLLVGQIGLSLSVVASMTLGIVVDDTVHFLSKYLRARREKNFAAPDAVRYAFATVGMALWITSLVLIAGFGILSLSAFELNAGMGLLTAITIALALAADFLFLPPLLMKLEEKRNETAITAGAADAVTP
ncbi:MAG: hypothetical protein DWQ09_08385 [Proteobacteria bacterium]|nr:MAG: hypothetical protein DWQ09_08385 [Pseudomonadota bacterium]QKK10814.1 MAG: MMPL family transporter [Pseudomonadota bacterium]